MNCDILCLIFIFYHVFKVIAIGKNCKKNGTAAQKMRAVPMKGCVLADNGSQTSNAPPLGPGSMTALCNLLPRKQRLHRLLGNLLAWILLSKLADNDPDNARVDVMPIAKGLDERPLIGVKKAMRTNCFATRLATHNTFLRFRSSKKRIGQTRPLLCPTPTIL